MGGSFPFFSRVRPRTVSGAFPRISLTGPQTGPPDLQVTTGLPPQVCVRLRAGGSRANGSEPRADYFEYNSTISCSCTGRLICSRVGIDTMRPDTVLGSKDSHSGIPRPFTSSIACSTVGFFWVRPMTLTTSPALTEYDGIST